MPDKIKIKYNIRLMRMIKALDNHIRLLIVQFVLNSSPVSFTQIHEYLKEESGEISKGTLSYHLDLLLEGEVLSKTLERSKGREYSQYNVTDNTEKIFESLGLLEFVK